MDAASIEVGCLGVRGVNAHLTGKWRCLPDGSKEVELRVLSCASGKVSHSIEWQPAKHTDESWIIGN